MKKLYLIVTLFVSMWMPFIYADEAIKNSTDEILQMIMDNHSIEKEMSTPKRKRMHRKKKKEIVILSEINVKDSEPQSIIAVNDYSEKVIDLTPVEFTADEIAPSQELSKEAVEINSALSAIPLVLSPEYMHALKNFNTESAPESQETMSHLQRKRKQRKKKVAEQSDVVVNSEVLRHAKRKKMRHKVKAVEHDMVLKQEDISQDSTIIQLEQEPEVIATQEAVVAQACEQKDESLESVEKEMSPSKRRKMQRKKKAAEQLVALSKMPLVLSPEYLYGLKDVAAEPASESQTLMNQSRKRRIRRMKNAAEQSDVVVDDVVLKQEDTSQDSTIIQLEQEPEIGATQELVVAQACEQKDESLESAEKEMSPSKRRKMQRKKKAAEQLVALSKMPLVLSPEYLYGLKDVAAEPASESQTLMSQSRKRRIRRMKKAAEQSDVVVDSEMLELAEIAHEPAVALNQEDTSQDSTVIQLEQETQVVAADQIKDEAIKISQSKWTRMRRKKKSTTSELLERSEIQEPEQHVQEQVCEVERPKLGIMLGREYHYALLDKSQDRHWAVPMSVYFDFANNYFDNNSELVGIGQGIIGSCITVNDIYLLSRLAARNLLSSSLMQPLTIGTAENDLALLGDVGINFNAIKQREVGLNLGVAYRFDVTKLGEVQLVFGGQLPVRSAHVNGSLCVNNTSNLTSLFGYSSVIDFILGEVLGKKGISFKSSQTKTGVGDLSLYGLVDFSGYTTWADGIQVGLNLVWPTGSRASGNILFEPNFSDGVYSFEPFVNMIFSTPSSVFNPSFKIVASVSKKGDAGPNGVRLARSASSTLTSTRTQVFALDGLNAPAFFEQYYVGPFVGESDSTVAALADNAVQATIKRGSKVLLSIGNYMFYCGFRLGLFYDYIYKGQDTIEVDCSAGSFDVFGATANTKMCSHSLGLNLTYKFENMWELNIGTQNVIAGKNIPSKNEVFASLILIF